VDDVISAREFVASQPYVDPARIYLGGHSTGGTMAMLVAASSDKFRAVFAFGPADNVAGYGSDMLPMVNLWNKKEVQLRSPRYWLHSIQSPTFVIEGATQGNADSVRTMQLASKNPLVQFFIVNGRNHFSVLAPVNQVLAQKVLADTGEKTNISIAAGELR
jgi:acetyl esterase/lipase